MDRVIDFLLAYRGLVDQIALHAILAYSQYIVLRAGVFSIATAGFASIGGYTAAIGVMTLGLPGPIAIASAMMLSMLVAVVIAWPLARLRGVFQAIATLAFVQIVLSFSQNATTLTNGALGINGIPKLANTAVLLMALGGVIYVLWCLDRSRYGQAFDAIRQDETVAVSMGISVFPVHMLAFALSGAIAGLGGGLEALHSYSITPEQFGFHLLVACLTFVVFGGRVAVAGPLVGAAILTLLPEIARPFKDYRLLVHGALLIAVITYLPDGIFDTLRQRWRARRRVDAVIQAETTDPTEGRHGTPVA
jgi:branched-chain amino acid transport system permease protein